MICLSALGKSNPRFPTFSNHQYSLAFTTISHPFSFSNNAFVAILSSKTTSNVLSQIYILVWPENWFDEQLEAWQLVLRWEYEDHTDIIFIDQEMWQNYVDPHKMIYGDSVSFKWEVEQIDWAAGTHYYNAVSIDTLEELFVVNENDTVLKLQDRTFVENNDESLATTDQIEKNVDISVNLNWITTEEREFYDENDAWSQQLKWIVDEIKTDYPNIFDERREYLIHFYDKNRTVWVVRFMHTINCWFEIWKNRIIQTNKSIICMYENGKITIINPKEKKS